MKKYSIRIILFFLILQSAYSLRWPVDNPVVIESFGEIRNGVFSTTISIRTNSGKIYAIADGRLVYLSNKSADPELNVVILEHENGLRSVYRNFFPLADIPGELREGGLIGTGPSVQLEILDTHSGEIGNPQILLPQLPDKSRPVIERLAFYRNGVFEDIKNRMVVRSGRKQLLLKVYDIHNDERLLPFSITLYIDSLKVQEYVFESLKYINERYQFPWAVGEEIFMIIDNEMYINLGEFSIMPGETRLELYVDDLAENRATVDVRLIASRN
ncbi:MAG: hypothetical protein JW874_11260 [Spirochaetales bacterium]|nr:hypothetical protein [Spirochaetales bacterium]